MAANVKKVILNTLRMLVLPVCVFVIMEILCRSIMHIHLINSQLDVLNLIRNIGITSGLAYALSMNLPSGRFDLSLGAQQMAGTILGGIIAIRAGLTGVWILLFALVCGLVFGLVTGAVFIITRVPPMVLGIGMGLVFECIAYAINGVNGLLLFGVEGTGILVNPIFVIALVLIQCVFMSFMSNRTVFGYHIRAIQGSQHIARNAGINVFLNALGCYTIAGGIVNMAGALNAAFTSHLKPSLGFSSNGTVLSACFPMMLGGVMARWSNPAIGILFSTISISIFRLGLLKLELSEAVSTTINMAVFLVLLVYRANAYLVEYKKQEKARSEEAKQKRLVLAEEGRKLSVE